MGEQTLIPSPIQEAVRPLLAALPLERAMPDLLPRGANAPFLELADGAALALKRYPTLVAAIWLYVDDIDRSHRISQTIPTETGSLWHAIMHRREGDFSNSKYWYRQAGVFPTLPSDPCGFVDAVASARGANPQNLVERQREEWRLAFELSVAEVTR